jgi:hypothetical protein
MAIQPSRPLSEKCCIIFLHTFFFTSHNQMAPTTLRANKAGSKTKATAAGAGASSSPKTTTTTTISSTSTTTTTTTTTAHSSASAAAATTPEAPKLKTLAVYRYATWLEENQLKKTAVWIAVATAVLVRWTVGLGPYSGKRLFCFYSRQTIEAHYESVTTIIVIVITRGSDLVI